MAKKIKQDFISEGKVETISVISGAWLALFKAGWMELSVGTVINYMDSSS